MVDFYGTVEGADEYLAARNLTGWATLTTEAKTAALVVASENSDATYATFFDGVKVGGRAQVRAWPRKGAHDVDGNALPADEIPIEQEQAAYQLAYRQGTAPGSLAADYVASGVIKKAAVEGAVSVEYGGDGSLQASQPVFPVVNAIIAPLLVNVSGFAALSGRSVRV